MTRVVRKREFNTPNNCHLLVLNIIDLAYFFFFFEKFYLSLDLLKPASFLSSSKN